MGVSLGGNGDGGGAGGGFALGPETNTFGTAATASRAAAETLRNTYAAANASWLAAYNADKSLIHLVWDDGDVVQRRNLAGDAWEDVDYLVVGRRGPGPTQAQLQAAIASGVTEAFILSLLGLSTQKLQDLFVGAQVTGSGENRKLVITQADDSTLELNVPDKSGGTSPGGGSVLAIGRVDINPSRVANAADLDGTYQIILSLTDAEVSSLVTAGVNWIEVWFGSESVHTVTPWAPAISTRIDTVVDTTEESAIGAPGTALAVRVVYRINQGGSQTYHGEGAGSLRIGGYPAFTADTEVQIDKGDDLQSITVGTLSNYNDAVAAQVNSDQPLEIVFSGQIVLRAGTAQQETYLVGDVLYFAPRSKTPERRFNVVTHVELTKESKERRQGDEITEYSTIQNAAAMTTALTTHNSTPADVLRAGLFTITADFTSSTRTYAAGQRWYLAPYHTTEGDMILFSEGAFLTQAQQIGLLHWAPEPAVIGYRTEANLAAEAKTVKLGVLNPELLTGDIWVEGWTQGQRGLARTKWSNTTNLTITVTDSWAAGIANNIATDGDGELEVRLRFFDAATGGNEVERIGFNIPIVDLRSIKTRFESVVGASPATLPVGTYEISALTSPGGSDNIARRILLSEISASDIIFVFRGSGSNQVKFTVRYDSATRVLTYSVDRRTISLKAIGEV